MSSQPPPALASLQAELENGQRLNVEHLGEMGIRPRLASPTTPWTATGSINHVSDQYYYAVTGVTPETPGGFLDAIVRSEVFGRQLLAIPPFSASFQSAKPDFAANSINWGASTPGAPGIILTLRNDLTGDSLTVGSENLPSGTNVTYTETINQPQRWFRSGIVTFDSHWGARFSMGTGSQPGGYGFDSALAEGCTITFFLTDGLISIANATTTHNSNNHNLRFQISTANVSVGGWSVDLKQDERLLRSFPPTTDNRGPGVGSGANPTTVSLDWNGLDGSGQPVTGNVTWVIADALQ